MLTYIHTYDLGEVFLHWPHICAAAALTSLKS